MLNVYREVTYRFRLYAILNYILHWLCKIENVSKQHVFLSVLFQDCYISAYSTYENVNGILTTASNTTQCHSQQPTVN
jgi:hypothetical protein